MYTREDLVTSMDTILLNSVELGKDYVGLGYSLYYLTDFIEQYIAEKLQGNRLPLVPTYEDTTIPEVARVVELSKVVGIDVFPESIGVELDMEETPEECTLKFRLRPYFTLESLVVFGCLSADKAYSSGLVYGTTNEEVTSIVREYLTNTQATLGSPKEPIEDILAVRIGEILGVDATYAGVSTVEGEDDGEIVGVPVLVFKVPKEVWYDSTSQ